MQEETCTNLEEEGTEVVERDSSNEQAGEVWQVGEDGEVREEGRVEGVEGEFFEAREEKREERRQRGVRRGAGAAEAEGEGS